MQSKLEVKWLKIGPNIGSNIGSTISSKMIKIGGQMAQKLVEK